MAHRLLRDVQADGWERSDFPIICESCLGDNPYIRMTKADYDQECKICTRPFTVFRWRPGRDARYKKTEICQTCTKLKNVCQVCLLDLEYGLPVQARDTALAINSNDAIPKSDVNREYFAEEHDRRARAGLDYESSYGKARPNDTILKLQRTTPYYKRNRAHVCSFYMRGECTRGAECPYRHEMPETGELSHQNIKDRYYGVNDPVALKLLNKAGEMPSLSPPDDESIRTLYVGGVDARIAEQDLRDHFYAHGEIESIRMVPLRGCSFVTYTTRQGAEKAAEELANKLVVKGLRLKLLWGRPQAPKPEAEDESARQGHMAHGGMLPRAILSQPQPPGTEDQHHTPQLLSYFNIPAAPSYPSMDPQRMGAVVPTQEASDSKNPYYYPPYGYMAAPPQPYHQQYPSFSLVVGALPGPPTASSSSVQQQFQPPPSSSSVQQQFQPPASSSVQQQFQPPPSSSSSSVQQQFQPPPSSSSSVHQQFQPPPSSSVQQQFQPPPPSVQQQFQPPPSSSVEQQFQPPDQ